MYKQKYKNTETQKHRNIEMMIYSFLVWAIFRMTRAS